MVQAAAAEVMVDPLVPTGMDRPVRRAELHEAITRGQLLLHYQPEVDLRDGMVIGVEALVRWQHPDKGLLGPDRFIPLAETTELYRPLTLEVLDMALAHCRMTMEADRALPVAVNLSARSLLDPGLSCDVVRLLKYHGVCPSLLRLEITETTKLTDPHQAKNVVTCLSALGIRFALDDYGDGFACLASLKHLPVHEIKIDKSFVRQLTTDPKDQVIVSSTIDLVHDLGLQVVAEGVESEETYRMLGDLGCDVAQGFWISPPLPADRLAAWLEQRCV